MKKTQTDFLVNSVFAYLYEVMWSFPGGSVVKNLPAMQELQETRVWSMSREDPLVESMATQSSILLTVN